MRYAPSTQQVKVRQHYSAHCAAVLRGSLSRRHPMQCIQTTIRLQAFMSLPTPTSNPRHTIEVFTRSLATAKGITSSTPPIALSVSRGPAWSELGP